MANYAVPQLRTDLHLAFSLALDLRTFDPDSESASHAFASQLQIGPYPSQSDRSFASYIKKNLVPMGLVANSGEIHYVTPAGLAWGEVCRLRPDGTLVIFGETIDADAWPTFDRALRTACSTFKQLIEQMNEYLGGHHTTPHRLTALSGASHSLHNLPNFATSAISVQIYREAAVLACREEMLRLRKRKDELELRARDRRVLDDVLSELGHLDAILAIPSLADAFTARKPRVTDFVNIGIIAASQGRATDEKFGILSVPTLFSEDFAAAAEGAFSRDRSFAVGFIDIDEFGKFNKSHSETVVDQDMLPNFMRALEAYCYARAYAYRQGGDEYLVLLHNANKEEAKVFFEGLQTYIAAIRYPETIQRKPTVSIGVHVIDGNNEVTVFEAKKLANDAKAAAKDAGRNCVCFSTDLPPNLSRPQINLVS
jgi:diguanylate cyclase (GGDEF)-like protein